MRHGTGPLITIRKLKANDKKPIRQMLEGTDLFTYDEIHVAMEIIDSSLHEPNQDDYYPFTAVNENDDVIGFLCLGPTPITDGTYDLYWIAVQQPYQRRGIGNQLLQFAEEFVVSRNGRLLVVETSSQPKYEKTRLFYKKNNYGELARIKDYYRVADDLVIFGKYFSQTRGK